MIDRRLCRIVTSEIIPQKADFILNLGSRAIIPGSKSDCDSSEAGPVILRIGRLPRFVVELNPRPSALVVSRSQLQSPHIVECDPRIRGKFSVLRVVARKNQRVEDSFGPARFVGEV